MITWLAVAFGGALGAMARFALSAWLVSAPGRFPVATFCANGIGCLLAGVLYVLIVDKQFLPISWRPLLMVGFLGAFTTFSAFSVEALNLWLGQHHSLAIVYVVASVIVSLLAVWAGYSASQFFLHS
jgi:fluoride exporter